MNTKRILQSFKKAIGIGFMPSEKLEKEPSIVKLSFLNPQDGVDGYECLLDEVGNTEATMIFTLRSKSKLDVQFIIKETGDNFKILNLNYNEEALLKFEKTQPKDKAYILLFGKTPTQSYEYSMTRQPFSPLVVDKYVIHHLP